MLHRMAFILLYGVFLLLPCVTLAANRFIDNGDGTVTDQQTGLMWAATDNMGDITWQQANRWIRYTFPDTLSHHYEDWRLPTLKELKTIFLKGSPGYESECGQRLHTSSLIHLSCGFVWSSDRQSITAQVFNFGRGTFHSDRLVHRRGHRALAVRKTRRQKN